MAVNSNAPVIAAAHTIVNATPEVIWSVISNIPDWPKWNPDVKSVSMNGRLEKDTTFQWKAGATKITSTLQWVEPPKMIGWTGRTMGIKAVHVWSIEAQGGVSVVRNEESWDGLLVRLLKGLMQRSLQKAIDSGLQYLKTEAELRM